MAHLREFRNLQMLFVGGKINNIDAIGSVSGLEFLSLNSVNSSPIGFINRLEKLKTLKFILGGRAHLDEIEENKIEILEIVRVRGFQDLRNIAKFKWLRSLLIEDQIRLQALHVEDTLEQLEVVKILNCKTFNQLKGLENLPALRHLRIFQTELDFDTFIRQPLPS